jgi:pyruvate-formate lyase-activating enzyme
VAEGYEKVFDALEYALGEGLIDPMAMWQLSCGEITIHPFAERLLDLAKDRVANFLTNCFRFDPRIAANLAANPNSIMNLSIDAGTGGTWRKVKGFDNFGAVVENLGRYRESCSRPDQITLKYLIFPGMNDGPEDIEGLIGLMKRLQTRTLSLARDCRTKYEPGKEDTEALLAAAAHFVAALYRNGLTCDMLWFAPSERERVKSLAVDVLRGQAP